MLQEQSLLVTKFGMGCEVRWKMVLQVSGREPIL